MTLSPSHTDTSSPNWQPQRVLLTGASGHIGRALREHLQGHYQLLRLCDITDLGEAQEGEELIQADITNLDQMRAAVQGMDAVIHLAGIPNEHRYEEIRRVNIDGTYNVLQAALEAGVRRVAFASSIHAVGYYPRELIGMDAPPRPDSYYGLSKVFGEGLGSMYHDRYGLEFVSVRINSFLPRPSEARNLATWLSPRDAAQLFRRAVDAPGVGYLVVAGISNNSNRWMKPDGWDILGYHPEDNAADYTDEVIHKKGDHNSRTEQHQGGIFTEPDYVGLAQKP